MNYATCVIDTVKAEMPDELQDDLLRLYTLLVFVKGSNTTLEDVHDAWAIWRQTSNSGHRSLIPFTHLSIEVQELDRVYMEAIHRASQLTASLQS